MLPSDIAGAAEEAEKELEVETIPSCFPVSLLLHIYFGSSSSFSLSGFLFFFPCSVSSLAQGGSVLISHAQIKQRTALLQSRRSFLPPLRVFFFFYLVMCY